MSTINNPNTEREATARSRRAFLTMGLGAAAGYGGWTWLRSQTKGRRRGMAHAGSASAETKGLPKLISATAIGRRNLMRRRPMRDPRKNGDVGLGDGL